MEKLKTAPLVSIIIPTFNSQKTIKQCLESIVKQTYKRIEILVVDRYSTDDTIRIARQSKAKVFLLKCERSEAKNYAARKAKGEFLLFIDSDMQLNPKIVEECVRECMESNIQAIIIPEEDANFGIIGELRKSERKLLSDLKELMEIPRFFKKDVFLKLEGFDEKLVCGEDFHFFQKFTASRYKVGKIKFKILHFENLPSIYNVGVKAYKYGKTLPNLIEKASKDALKRYAVLRLTSIQKIGAYVGNLKGLLTFSFMKGLEFLGYFLGVCVGVVGKWFPKENLIKIAAKIREKRSMLMTAALFTLIALIIFRNFLFTNEAPAGNDIFGWISREYIFARDYRWLYIWRPYSFGFVEGINLIDLFFMLIHFVFVDAVLTIKVFAFLSFLLAGFSMYTFAYSHTHNNIAAFFAVMVYTLNPLLFSQLTEGHVDMVFSYALAPLIFLFIDRALRTGKLKDILYSTIALSIFLAGFHANCVVIYGVFMILFLLIFLIFPAQDIKFITRSKNLLKFLAVCAITVFLLTAFFTIPFFMNVKAHFLSEEYKYQIEEAEYFSAANLTEAFTLGATEEGGYIKIVNIRGFGLPDFPVQTFLFCIFLISYSAILVRRDRYTVFFLMASVISVFISKGPNPPVGDFFTWAWLNIPYFAVFRRPSRWEMMTAFSNAFFVALFVTFLLNYIVKKPEKSKNNVLSVKMENFRHKHVKEFYVSINFLSKWFSAFRKIFRFAGIAIMILIILSGPISCWFFFYNGLLTYKIPKDYVEPFQWMAEQPGQYKIITVNKSPGEWENDPNAGTDFAFCRMLNEIGWVHDIGFDSSIFHDKPVLQDGGWEPASKAFVDYLRQGLVYSNATDDFLKILGLFDYKYVVIPSYSSEKVKNFILNQEGSSIIYNESNSLIVENGYFTQEIFSPKDFVIVTGGLETFPSLCKIDSFNLNETALFFINPNSAEQILSNGKIDFSKALVLTSGANLTDIVIPLLGDSAKFIKTKDYAVPSSDKKKYWISTSFWRDMGKLAPGEETLTTCGKNKVQIPFAVNSDGEYELWIRIAFAPDRGKLNLYIDDEFLTEIAPTADYWVAVKWVKVANLNIKNGSHILTLQNDGSGYNDVEAICIVEKSIFQAKLNEFIEKIQSSENKIIHVIQPEDFLEENKIQKWTIKVEPYEGHALSGEDALLNISPEGTISASSTQILQNVEYEAKYAADGNLTTRWASALNQTAPQWLQINWTNPQEIVAVKVLFETAYAKDYLIQAWDDEKSEWLTLVNMSEVDGTSCPQINNGISCLHIFEKPINTTKLRIYITAFSTWPLVSIWELETYKIATSTTLSILRDGNYRCFIRVNSTSENGKIYLKLGEKTSEISLSNSSNKYEWFDAGTFRLNAGEQRLSIGTIGKVGIGQILLYSLSENENLNLSELFTCKTNAPAVEYEKVNPCTYKVRVNASEPFLLVLSESYNPLWKALVGDEEISPVPIYSIVNGFFVNKTGNLTMTIQFTGQTYVDVGLKIALTSLIFIAAVILTPSKFFNKLISKTKALKRKLKP
ncbi:MAG: glycosyltransferase [Candidatus Bathyarchaeia archaeon]